MRPHKKFHPVFPNPVDNTFIIDLPSERIVTSQIFDSSRKLVLSVSTDPITKLKVGGLTSGLYTLQIITEDHRTYGSKFVKK